MNIRESIKRIKENGIEERGVSELESNKPIETILMRGYGELKPCSRSKRLRMNLLKAI